MLFYLFPQDFFCFIAICITGNPNFDPLANTFFNLVGINNRLFAYHRIKDGNLSRRLKEVPTKNVSNRMFIGK